MGKIISSELSNLREAIRYIAQEAEKVHLTSISFLEIQVAVEEAIVNIIRHGYSKNKGDIEIDCSIKDPFFFITITDKAQPFDPISSSAASLGIQLMKATTDTIKYTRYQEKNILTLSKRAYAHQ